MTLDVGKRELVRGGGTPIPAFRVEMEFAGLRTTSWITDTGEVVREESPLGLITVRESPENAQSDGGVGPDARDLLAGVVGGPAACESRSTSRATSAGCGCGSTARTSRPPDHATAAAQRVDGDVVELRDPQDAAGRARAIRTPRSIWRRSRSSKATRRKSSPKPRPRCAASPAIARAPSG